MVSITRSALVQLGDSTIAALHRAHLDESLDDITLRVLPHESDADTTWIELVLYEIRDIARRPHMTHENRLAQVWWTITMVGW